jgi:hypothetical protein
MHALHRTFVNMHGLSTAAPYLSNLKVHAWILAGEASAAAYGICVCVFLCMHAHALYIRL